MIIDIKTHVCFLLDNDGFLGAFCAPHGGGCDETICKGGDCEDYRGRTANHDCTTGNRTSAIPYQVFGLAWRILGPAGGGHEKALCGGNDCCDAAVCGFVAVQGS